MSDQREINISNIIEERKSERKRRAEERRQKGLDLIKSINRKNDGVDPLYIFPREMWEMISKNVSDFKNLENMWDVCTLFRELLEDRRYSEILFSKAVEVLDFYDEVEESGTRKQNWLYLRLVCSSWKNTIDRLHAGDRVKKKILVDDFCATDDDLLRFAPLQLSNTAQAEVEFLKNLRILEDLSKPGALKLSVRQEFYVDMCASHILTVDFNQCTSTVTKALQHIGDTIFYFRLDIELHGDMVMHGITFREFYPTLVKWITLMPNVECLNVTFKSGDVNSDPSLCDVIQSLPFPKMKKLKQLEIELVKDEDPNRILEAILSSNQNTELDNLVVHVSDPEVDDRVIQLIKSLDLSSFSFFRIGDQPGVEVDWFLNSSWRLKQMRSDFYPKGPFSAMLRVLEQYPTLEAVALDINLFDDDYDKVGENKDFLHLPNLKQFKINLYGDYPFTSSALYWNRLKRIFSVDYLLHCTNLETMYWRDLWDEHVPKKGKNGRWKELIQFKEGRANFKKSNIWRVFPVLKMLTIETKETSLPETFYRPTGANNR